MSPEIQQINAKLDEVIRRLDALATKPKPHLSRVEFAGAANLSVRTVQRKINRGLIRTEKGRIPFSELRKFVS